MKNGSDNWLFFRLFHVFRSKPTILFVSSKPRIYELQEQRKNYNIVCGGQKSKKPIQREIAPLPPRRPPRKKEKLEDF